MRRFIPIAILLIVLFAGCKKSAQNIIKNQTNKTPPTAFTVKVTDREDTYAQIKWNPSVSSDTTLVTYSVTLNGVKLVAGLTDTTYKILNLVDTVAYAGQVIATDKRGQTTTDTFTVHKAPGVLYVTSGSRISCYTLGGDLRWTVAGSFTGYPAISHDTIFAMGTNLVAMNAKTGDQYWSSATNGPDGGLVYYGGMLFANLPQTNQIIAVNAKTGNRVWALTGGSAYAPTISKGILYYENPDGQGGASFIAVDAKTGVPKWNMILHGNTAVPVAVNGTAFIQSSATDPNNAGGYLYARDAATGGYKWSFGFNGEVGVNYQSRPVVVGNVVYFLGYKNEYGTPNTLYAVNISDGTPKWQKPAFTGAASGSVFGGPDGIYVNGREVVEKFDLNTGALLWSIPVTGSFNGVTNVAVSPGSLYFNMVNNGASFIQQYNSSTGAITANWLPVGNWGGYIIVIDRKAYYPYSSGMNSTN